MSQENIEKVLGAYEAFNRRDFDAAIEFAHPDVEFVRVGGQFAVTGAPALRAWMEPDAIEDARLEPVECQSNGNKVLVHVRTRGRGAQSGIEMEGEAWAVFTLDEDGLVTRLEAFLVHERHTALVAAGLAE